MIFGMSPRLWRQLLFDNAQRGCDLLHALPEPLPRGYLANTIDRAVELPFRSADPDYLQLAPNDVERMCEEE
jgi:hypothetical protein